jgi:predicted porin
MQFGRLAFGIVLAAAAAAVQAQTHLALYGIVDVGYLVTNPAQGPIRREVADGVQSPSRFGVRGVERLTPDINAIFMLEAGIALDSGRLQQDGRLFGRQAWAGLVTTRGDVRLGRQQGIGYEYFVSGTSPFGTTFRDAGSGSLFSSASDRLVLDNAVMLRTRDYDRFAAAVGYSFNADGSELAGGGRNVSAWTAGARYDDGKLYLAASYERFQCPDAFVPGAMPPAASNTCNSAIREPQSHLQLGGSYALSAFRLYGMWAREENQFGFFAVTPAKKASVYELGVKFRLGAGELLAAYQGRDDDFDANLDGWGLGYTYALSRQTNLYTFVSDTRAGDNPALQEVAAGRVVREGYTPAQVAAYRERDRLQVAVGVRHIF